MADDKNQAAAEEARNLAHEAMEEARTGNKEEAKFLENEARSLDPKVAAEAIRQEKAKSG